MAIKVTERADHSYLFDSLNNNASGASNNIFNSINLSEYHSIKSGAYGKALKTYYAQKAEESSSADKVDKDKETDKKVNAENTAVEKLTEVSGNVSAFKESAEKLINRGDNSLFNKTQKTITAEDGTTSTVEEYDVDAIYSAVNDFASKYNSLLTSMKDSSSYKVTEKGEGLTDLVQGYESALNNIGITIGEDNKLSVSKEEFKAADMENVKKLFNGNTSFAYIASTRASIVGSTANSEAKVMRPYNSEGAYDDKVASTGNLLDSLI